ncbi:MAG: hypothetical protein KF754_04800 [Planctomycetes bacterium]|nr:hypothetical protein [Planctomycetota bacterium]
MVLLLCASALGAQVPGQASDQESRDSNRIIKLVSPTDADIAALEGQHITDLVIHSLGSESLTVASVKRLLSRDSLVSVSLIDGTSFRYDDVIASSLPSGLLRLQCDSIFQDSHLVFIGKLTRLAYLDIRYSGSGKGLLHLKELASLDSLIIEFNGFSNFDDMERSRVDDSALARFLENLTRLQCVGLSNSTLLGNLTCKVLASMKSLQSLRLHGLSRLNSADIGLLCATRYLQRLELSHCGRLTDDVWGHLGRIPSLIALSVRNCAGLRQVFLEELGKASALQELALYNEPSLQLAHQREGSPLHFMIRQDTTKERDTCFQFLRTLVLSEQPKLGDEAFEFLAQGSRLESLLLTHCAILSESALHSLGRHKSLNRLEAYMTPGLSSSVLQLLFDKCALTHVELTAVQGFDDDAAAALAGRGKCHTLMLRKCHLLGANGIASLTSIDKLRVLDRSGNLAVDATACKSLAAMKQLTTLNLSDTRVDDKCVEWLAASKSLRSLGLAGCRVTESSVRLFLSKVRLEKLTLFSCPAIDRKAVDALRRDFPACDIGW